MYVTQNNSFFFHELFISVIYELTLAAAGSPTFCVQNVLKKLSSFRYKLCSCVLRVHNVHLFLKSQTKFGLLDFKQNLCKHNDCVCDTGMQLL